MSALYIRLFSSFFTHRKTARLRAKIGDDAFWVPPRLWAYAAENQPDGDFNGYSSEELAMLIGCDKHASSIKQALLDAGFLDASGKIHDWEEHNGYHKTFSERAKKAALARWGDKEKEIDTEKEIDIEHCSEQCLEHASSIPDAKSEKQRLSEAASKIIEQLNGLTGRDFREVDSNISLIVGRLKEQGVTVDGCLEMIRRQCQLWMGDPQMERYLRPETLFRKNKFDGYYASRGIPIQSDKPMAVAIETQKPVWVQIQELETRIAKHPANTAMIGSVKNPTPEQKDDLRGLRKRLDALRCGQTEFPTG